MKVLEIETIKDFAPALKEQRTSLADSVVEGIETALLEKKKSAVLFEIKVLKQPEPNHHVVSLPSSEWSTTLQAQLKHYREKEDHDSELETWLVLKKVKEILKE